MKNEGIFKMNIDTIDYEIRFDTIRLLDKKQDLPIRLSPGSEDTFRLPVAVPLTKLIGRIGELQHRDSADIKSDVRIVYNTVFGHNSLRHKKTSRIAMPVPPEFELEKVEFDRIRDGFVYLSVTVAFVNRGTLTMQIDSLRYRVGAGDLAVASGHHNKLLNILPGKTLRETIPVAIELNKPAKALFLIATNRDKVHYNAKVQAIVNSGGALRSTNITVTKKGELELRK